MRVVATLVMLVVLGCGDPDDTTETATWQRLGAQLPSSLLSVWAPTTDNVWIVGGREGLGGAPVVWHYDGTAWAKIDTRQVNVDLWSVFGFDDGTVFLAGSNGTILRYRDGAIEKITTPSTDIVFGMWGASSSDVWAVGGQTNGRGFVWRYQGTSFEVVSGVPAELAMGTVWKVTGRAADDVWFSCTDGLVLHWDGAALASERVGTESESLFSIGCNADRCVTVGTNQANGVLYHHEQGAWTSRVPTSGGPVWRGVTTRADYVVGMVGTVIQYRDGTWVPDVHGLTTESLHAAWSDDEGNVFTVGGKFDRAPTTDGVLLFKGAQKLPELPL